MLRPVHVGLLLLVSILATVRANGLPDEMPAMSEYWAGMMDLHRDDWCFDCVDLCVDEKLTLTGEPLKVERVKESVVSTPAPSPPLTRITIIFAAWRGNS